MYEFFCECGRPYVGETGRKASTRKKEHLDNFRLGKKGKTKLTDHALENNHLIFENKFKITKLHVLDTVERRVCEAIQTLRRGKIALNGKEGYRLSRIEKFLILLLDMKLGKDEMKG